jgi:hypothetical protein
LVQAKDMARDFAVAGNGEKIKRKGDELCQDLMEQGQVEWGQ